jgi:hypothetical protein
MSWALWLLLIVALIVGFSIYNGFRTRCPACGAYALHPTDNEAQAAQAEAYRNAQRVFQGRPLPDFVERPGYSTRNFRCKDCNHPFDRGTAITWLTVANKLGEEAAVKGYKDVVDERPS